MKSKNRYCLNKTPLSLAIAVAGLTAASAALAADDFMLEEVIVTAEKREQSLQDVPISLAVFDTKALQTLRIFGIEDLSGKVPNMTVNPFNTDPSSVRLFIRGIGQNDVQLTQDPSVALYMDGVYVGTSIGSSLEMTDLEQVEVLRGPQGTLYGRNATGGAVSLRSAKPTLGEFKFKQVLEAGNLGAQKAKTSFNIPMGEKAALKLSGLYSKRDGLVENLGVGEDWGTHDRTGWRADFRVEFSDDFLMDLSYDNSTNEDSTSFEQTKGGEVLFPVTDPYFLGPAYGYGRSWLETEFSQPSSDSRIDKAMPYRAQLANKLETEGAALNMAWNVSESWTIKSITGYRSFESAQHHDGTPMVQGAISTHLLGENDFPTNVPGDDNYNFFAQYPPGFGFPHESYALTASAPLTEFDQFSQEFQFIGDTELFGGGLDYVGGLYYYKDEATNDTLGGESIQGPTPGNGGVPTTSENTSKAIFGQATWTPNALQDSLHITLGARYSKDEREASRVNEGSYTFAELGGFTSANCAYFNAQGLAPQTCVGNDTGVIEGASYQQDFSQFNPALTIAYDFNDDMNMYFKIVEGYKSGGTSTRSANPINFALGFEPEEILSYELGYKGQLANNRLRLNAALFNMDIDGFQASVQTGANAGARDFAGIDGTKIKGIELDVTWLITERLRVAFNYGHLDTELGAKTLDTLLSTGEWQTTVLTEQIAYAPENSYTLSLDHDVEIGRVKLASHIGYTHQDEMVTSINVADNRNIDSYGLLNANFNLYGIEVLKGELSLSLWGKNLTDEEFVIVDTSSLQSLGVTSWSTYGAPRTYGLTLTYLYN
ncbi:MAG: TonB-dependent receptor [Pseudomonadales bacterium]